jgi:hypothetical protein
MKNLGLLIISALILSACQTSYVATSAYDDVYYTPKNAAGKSTLSSQENTNPGLNYGNNAETERFTQTSDPEVKYVEGQDNTATYSEETLPSPSSESSDEYYYVEEGTDDYYDYDYASRINHFNGSYVDAGYYSPIYTGIGYSPYSGFGMSVGYGYGMPYAGFSMSLGWGMGYPYYYDPWYYDPWYYPYYGYGYYPYYGYPYYGGSYWCGYYDGYYAGSGGYYPSDGGNYSGNYYGPRNSRSGSQISQGGDSRDSRAGSIDDQDKLTTGYSSGRDNRMTGSEVAGGTSATKAVITPENGRTSREIQPTAINNETIGSSGSNGVSGTVTSDKLVKPQEGANVSTNAKSQQQTTLRNERNSGEIQSQKITKPLSTPQEVPNNQRNVRTPENVSGGTKYTKPAASSNENNVYSRSKKYAKPATAETQRSAQPKNYNSPNYNKPRSSNEYTVPNSPNTRANTQPANTNTRNSNVQTQSDKSRNYYTPSKSNNSFSTPGRSNSSTVSPSKSGGGTSTPARSGSSYSSPSRSSGSSSTPARSGSSVSPSSGGSRSSGSSSGSSSGGSSGGSSRSSGGSSGGSGRR